MSKKVVNLNWGDKQNEPRETTEDASNRIREGSSIVVQKNRIAAINDELNLMLNDLQYLENLNILFDNYAESNKIVPAVEIFVDFKGLGFSLEIHNQYALEEIFTFFSELENKMAKRRNELILKIKNTEMDELLEKIVEED